MGCKARSIRADASRRETGSGRGAGNPVTFRIVGETNGIRMADGEPEPVPRGRLDRLPSGLPLPQAGLPLRVPPR
ncbi:hypothetical protein GCM10017784_13550 [Deinococcus indicus]|nr:hypothetical protein GCM10017784_13550 [Deinococcus indicus]